MAIRPNIRGLNSDPDQIALLRQALERMKSLSDDRGYEWFASIHALSLPQWCEHGTPQFLPWHRAYLFYFELALQTRLGPRFTIRPPQVPELADVALPWWDWTSNESHTSGIPESYAAATADGDPNALFDSQIASCIGGDQMAVGVWSSALVEAIRTQRPGALTTTDPPRTRRDPDDPDELPRQSSLDQFVMNQTTYGTFRSALEQVHNDVHVWVGGSMSQVPTAAYDPIFWSHHAMIDRLWYMWQISDAGQDPPADVMNTILMPFPLTAGQVLDIEQLGYDYAVQVSG